MQEDRERDKGTTINQTINSAENVAGRDIHSTINNITYVHVLNQLIKQIEEDENLEKDEKAGMIDALKKIVKNPYVIGLSTRGIYELLKSLG